MAVQLPTIVLFLIVLSSIGYCKSRPEGLFRRPNTLNGANGYWDKKGGKYMKL